MKDIEPIRKKIRKTFAFSVYPVAPADGTGAPLRFNNNKSYELRMKNKIFLDDLIQRVIAEASLEMAQLRSPKRDAKTSKVRSIIAFWQ